MEIQIDLLIMTEDKQYSDDQKLRAHEVNIDCRPHKYIFLVRYLSNSVNSEQYVPHGFWKSYEGKQRQLT